MIAVLGSFRFPADAIERARPLMLAVIDATRAERGCRAYAYAEDVTEPGLFRVLELWDDRHTLSVHFQAQHMREWSEQRTALGFFDRQISVHEIGPGETL